MSDDTQTKNWGCSECRGEEYSDGDELRGIRNCASESNLHISWDWMPTLKRCPWSQLDPSTMEVFRWWTDWSTLEMLPWHGSMLEQPAFVVEALQLCESIKADVEKTIHDDMTAKNSGGRRG